MPNPGSSSGLEGDSRYGDLLHPCSDAAKNWEINVSELLKEYLNELAEANVELHNGEFTLNFAEAALLIQGSAAIYSKKVEYLYNLASQMLVNLKKDKQDQASESTTSAKPKETILGAASCSEFVSLDHLTKCDNLNLTDDCNSGKKNSVRKTPMTPLSLIPLDASEKGNVMLYSTKGDEIGNKNDFQLNVCTIHSSGCLLLPSTEYDYFFNLDGCNEGETEKVEDGPLDAEEEEDGPMDAEEGEDDDCPSDPFIPDADPEENAPLEENSIGCTSTPNHNSGEVIPSLPNLESEQVEERVPVGKSAQRRKSLRQILKAQKELEEKKKKEEKEKTLNKNAWSTAGDLPAELNKPIQKKVIKKLPKKLLKKKGSTKSLAPGEKDSKDNSALLFCNKNFFSVESPRSKKAGAANKLSINEAFDDLIAEQYSKQKAAMRTCRKRLKLEDNVEVKEEPAEVKQDSDEAEDDDLGAAPLPDHDDDDDGESPAGAPLPSPENSVEAVASTSGINAPHTYEDHVQRHVQNYLKDVAQFCLKTDLSERVSEWEERIKPKLEEESKRESYNIHAYGTRIIDKFGDNNRKQTLEFKDICKGKPKWEVCRYFLASLQLANNSNLEITTSPSTNGMDNVELTLLSRKRHQEQLDEFGQNGGEH